MNHTFIIFSVAMSILFSACDRYAPPHAPPKPNPSEQAISHARQIVSDPSNWKNNTALLTDLGSLAQDLGIADTQEFKDFDSAAQDLIRFGTIWISSLDDGIKSRLRTELSHVTTRTEASLQAQVPLGTEPVPTGVGAHANSTTTKDAEQVQSDAERVIFSTVNGLRAAQADEFGKFFARAQTTYRALRLVLQKNLSAGDAVQLAIIEAKAEAAKDAAEIKARAAKDAANHKPK